MEELMDLKERMERERPAQWHELPDIALYMDQIISYMPRQLIHFDDSEALTSAMVNNYIKDGLVPRASGKAGGGGAHPGAGGALPLFLRGPGPGPVRHCRRH